jgi:hypothetical protein
LDDRDLFRLHLGGLIANSMGAVVVANVSTYIRTVDEADVCRVHVHASGFPVDVKVTVDKNGQMIKKTAFYVRASNATSELPGACPGWWVARIGPARRADGGRVAAKGMTISWACPLVHP